MDVNQEGRVDRFDVVDGWIIVGKLLIGELRLTIVLAEGNLLEALVLACITCCLDVVFVGEQAVNMPAVLHILGEIPYHTDVLFHHGRRHGLVRPHQLVSFFTMVAVVVSPAAIRVRKPEPFVLRR